MWLQGKSTDLPAVCHLLATCGSEGRVKVVSCFNLCPWNSNGLASGAMMLFMQPPHTSVFLKASLICSEIPCNAGGNVNVRLQHSDVQITGASCERLRRSGNSCLQLSWLWSRTLAHQPCEGVNFIHSGFSALKRLLLASSHSSPFFFETLKPQCNWRWRPRWPHALEAREVKGGRYRALGIAV